MKALAAVVATIVLAIMCLPVLFAHRGSPPDPMSRACPQATTPVGSGNVPADVDPILATIRQRESGGNYQARAPGSTASGAYQFIDTTWAGYGGHPDAWMAPPEIQDAKAAEHVTGILDANGGDINAVPVVWYIGWYPAPDDPAWDTVPAPGSGNRLTPRQYRDEWMTDYLQHLNDPGHSPGSGGGNAGPGDSRGLWTAAGQPGADDCGLDPQVEGTVLPDGWAYPGPTELFAAAPVDEAHHDYPAWDWSIPPGTPVYAVRGGHVVWVSESPGNCFNDAGDSRCPPCGMGLTIEDDTHTRWTYCHGSQLHAHQGDTIPAGALIMTSGNTGRSTGPHLHLAIRTLDGSSRCPQPLLAALRDRGAGLDPRDLPSTGCSY